MSRERTCPHYVAGHDGKRCVSYLQGGGCSRDDTFMCVEWLRANGSRERKVGLSMTPTLTKSALLAHAGAAPPAATTPHGGNLFGELVRSQPATALQESSARKKLSSQPATMSRVEVPFAPPVTSEQVAALESLGLELCLRSAAFAELWLVPVYTRTGRHEMTFRDAATLATVCAVFPGAEVTKVERRASDGEGTKA